MSAEDRLYGEGKSLMGGVKELGGSNQTLTYTCMRWSKNKFKPFRKIWLSPTY